MLSDPNPTRRPPAKGKTKILDRDMAILTLKREVALFLAAVVLASSWSCSCGATAEKGGGREGTGGTSCVTKLLPCQAFLESDTRPPAVCCLPLRKLIGDDPECLCTVFNDDKLLNSLNVTKEDALGLTKRCSATVHIDKCKQFVAPAPAPASVPPSKETSSATTCAFHGEKTAGVAAGALAVIGWTYVTALVL